MRYALILLLVTAASTSPAAGDAAGIEALLEKAGELHAEALRLEHGWSTTQPLIDDAGEALADGDLDRAQALAERALLLAEKSVVQAEAERRAWRDRVVVD